MMGSKIDNLKLMLSNGINVPSFIVLSDDFGGLFLNISLCPFDIDKFLLFDVLAKYIIKNKRNYF